MIPERIKKRLVKNRPMTAITLRVPADAVASMKEIAPKRGFAGYQPLLRAYISEGLRRDEAQFAFGPAARLLDALKKRGVSSKLLEAAARDSQAA
jgi:hypothetical protein